MNFLEEGEMVVVCVDVSVAGPLWSASQHIIEPENMDPERQLQKWTEHLNWEAMKVWIS